MSPVLKPWRFPNSSIIGGLRSWILQYQLLSTDHGSVSGLYLSLGFWGWYLICHKNIWRKTLSDDNDNETIIGPAHLWYHIWISYPYPNDQGIKWYHLPTKHHVPPATRCHMTFGIHTVTSSNCLSNPCQILWNKSMVKVTSHACVKCHHFPLFLSSLNFEVISFKYNRNILFNGLPDIKSSLYLQSNRIQWAATKLWKSNSSYLYVRLILLKFLMMLVFWELACWLWHNDWEKNKDYLHDFMLKSNLSVFFN